MATITRSLILSLLFPVLFAGCSSPTASLDMISVARKGIRLASEGEAQVHNEILQRLQSQVSALDSAFDVDVRLVAAGQILDANDNPVELSSQWVISARKGYIAARDLTTKQIQLSKAAHVKRLDNLKTSAEALEMASNLIVQQWNVANRIKQHILEVQRRFIND